MYVFNKINNRIMRGEVGSGIAGNLNFGGNIDMSGSLYTTNLNKMPFFFGNGNIKLIDYTGPTIIKTIATGLIPVTVDGIDDTIYIYLVESGTADTMIYDSVSDALFKTISTTGTAPLNQFGAFVPATNNVAVYSSSHHIAIMDHTDAGSGLMFTLDLAQQPSVISGLHSKDYIPMGINGTNQVFISTVQYYSRVWNEGNGGGAVSFMEVSETDSHIVYTTSSNDLVLLGVDDLTPVTVCDYSFQVFKANACVDCLTEADFGTAVGDCTGVTSRGDNIFSDFVVID
jgi:hypothetical protein